MARKVAAARHREETGRSAVTSDILRRPLRAAASTGRSTCVLGQPQQDQPRAGGRPSAPRVRDHEEDLHDPSPHHTPPPNLCWPLPAAPIRSACPVLDEVGPGRRQNGSARPVRRTPWREPVPRHPERSWRWRRWPSRTCLPESPASGSRMDVTYFQMHGQSRQRRQRPRFPLRQPSAASASRSGAGQRDFRRRLGDPRAGAPQPNGRSGRSRLQLGLIRRPAVASAVETVWLRVPRCPCQSRCTAPGRRTRPGRPPCVPGQVLSRPPQNRAEATSGSSPGAGYGRDSPICCSASVNPRAR